MGTKTNKKDSLIYIFTFKEEYMKIFIKYYREAFGER